MTRAPGDLLAVRRWLLQRVIPNEADMIDDELTPGEVGIVGDRNHQVTGGYHEGSDDLTAAGLLHSDYSVRQLRDIRGLTDSASALDIGSFRLRNELGIITHGTLGALIVQRINQRYPGWELVREVIYSPDGRTVHHYDAIGEQHGGGTSHYFHTHISFWRDTEGYRQRFIPLLASILFPSEVSNVLTLARRKTEPHVWLCDGITRRWIVNESQLADVRYLSTTGQISPLFAGGDVQAVDDLEAYGVPAAHGPVPAGTPEADLLPDQVDD